MTAGWIAGAQESAVLAEGAAHVASMKVRIDLGQKSMERAAAESLDVGSVIELDSRVSDRVDVYVEGRLLAHGEAVVVDLKGPSQGQRLGVVVRDVVAELNRQTLGHYVPQAAKAVCGARGAIAGLLMLLALAMPGAARADGTTTAPATQAAQAGTDDVNNRMVGAGTEAKDKAGKYDVTQIGQTAGALAIVVAMIFVCRALLRRWAGRKGSVGGEVIHVLARAALDAKHPLALVRLGGRLVLVGYTNESMTPLMEVSDPAEVMRLMESAEQTGAEGLKDIFRPTWRAGQSASRTQAGELAEKLRQRMEKKD